MFGMPPGQILGSGTSLDKILERAADSLEHAPGTARELVEEGLGIGLESIQGATMVVVGHPSTQDPKQVIQGLQLWRIGREEDQVQPGAMPLQERSDLSRLLRAMEPGIVGEHDGLAPTRPRPVHEDIHQGAEGQMLFLP